MVSYLWFKLRLEYEWISWNDGFSVRKESIYSFQKKLLHYKFKEESMVGINVLINYDLIQTKEFPDWEITIGYPISNYFNPMFGIIPKKDFITISLQKISSRFVKGKEEGDSSFSLYQQPKTFFNYYVEKIDDEGINIINGPLMDDDETYRTLVEPTINVSSYYIEESF